MKSVYLKKKQTSSVSVLHSPLSGSIWVQSDYKLHVTSKILGSKNIISSLHTIWKLWWTNAGEIVQKENNITSRILNMKTAHVIMSHLELGQRNNLSSSLGDKTV